MLHNWSIYMNFFQFQFILILLSRIHIPIHILFAVQIQIKFNNYLQFNSQFSSHSSGQVMV